MNSFRVMLCSAAVVALASGCESAPDRAGPFMRTSGAALTAANGSSLNGSSLNGSSLNGSSLNGSSLNGSSLNGSSLNGDALNTMLVSVSYDEVSIDGVEGVLPPVQLDATQFSATVGETTYRGEDFHGARFVGTLGSGETRRLRVDGMFWSDAGYWTYQVNYLHTDGLWYPICTTPEGDPVNAVPVAGRWDYTQGTATGGAYVPDEKAFTFACENAAIGKCVHWGYQPWVSAEYADHHQACTRMVRADYCGDGASHTVNGQWVNMYDSLGIQVDTEDWAVEAEWEAGGARCVANTHRAHEEVTCSRPLDLSDCGAVSHFQEGARLISETPY